MARSRYGKRRFFLNTDQGVAAASFNVDVADNSNKEWPTLDVTSSISMSDCHRQITLEFDLFASKDKKENRAALRRQRKKLERLRLILDEFIEATSKAYDHFENSLDGYNKARAKYEQKKK